VRITKAHRSIIIIHKQIHTTTVSMIIYFNFDHSLLHVESVRLKERLQPLYMLVDIILIY